MKIIDRWLVVMGILSIVFFVCLWNNRDAQGNVEYYEGSNSVAMCEYIELDLLKTNVELIPYSGSRIKFEYKSLVPIEVLTGDNRLVVNESDELKVSFMTGDSTQFGLKLYLPKQNYRSITVYTSSGNVDIGGVKAEIINVITNSGNIAASSTRSVVNLTSGSGNILLDLDKVKAGSSILSRSGNAEIRFVQGSSVALSYKTDTGIFRTDLLSADIKGSYMYSFSGGENLIHADVSRGVLTVRAK